MKSTLADIRQLFNVKGLKYGSTPEQLLEGEIGIFDANSTTSIASSIDTFAELPDEFRILANINGKIAYSLENIRKDRIFNKNRKIYQPEVSQELQGVFSACDCSKSVYMNIIIEEEGLMRRDGMNWTHRDYVFEVTPAELACFCDCSGKSVYDNHVITKLLYDKIKANNSPYYDAEVYQLNADGTRGAGFANSAAIQTFIDANKTVNTDTVADNQSLKLMLVVKGKPQTRVVYHDLEPSYVYPRGVKLHVSGTINDKTQVQFKETRELVYENGAGYDMRHEEWENMSNYSMLNHYPQLSDGLASPDLYYQFENRKNYDVITFEYDSAKTKRAGEPEQKRLMIILGTETGTTLSTTLATLFGTV